MNKSSESKHTRCGFIAIVGRPNVGKSTLLNHLLRQKVSITSRKPQTTRHRILGINSDAEHQCIYVDTPGLHSNQQKALNKVMNNTVVSVINDVDLILFLIEKTNFNEGDHRVLELLSKTHTPVLLLINKIDLVKDKESLLPHINALSKQQDFNEIVPVSALGGHNLRKIEELVKSYLPRREFLFPEDQVTDRSSRFLAAELIREKVIRQLGDELPYEVTVEIENFQQQESILHIHGLILVEKAGPEKNPGRQRWRAAKTHRQLRQGRHGNCF
ncbi:MAG: GTPase Era [Gammaproteobacteria bacterium]|nr:MAG: GTPase Era [Gammaproteobacteria bacterium]